MAKIGEGDPRWIVEERPDATNVNNWHWTEKNATPWSKDKLTELLLKTFITDDDLGQVELLELSKFEGDATASNRKGKVIYFYEFSLMIEWSVMYPKYNDNPEFNRHDPHQIQIHRNPRLPYHHGTDRNTAGLTDSAWSPGGHAYGHDGKFEGSIEILNLSEENSVDEIDIEVTTKEKSDGAHQLKEMIRTKGLQQIREKLGQYIIDLNTEFGSGMILPRKNDGTSAINTISTPAKKTKKPQNSTSINSSKSEVKNSGECGVKFQTVKYTSKQTFKCRIAELYNVFTIKQLVQAFTRSEAEIEAVKGGSFNFFGGNVSGKFIDLVENKKLVMNWRLRSWPTKHYSVVTIELEEKEDCTELKLTQTGIPDEELESTTKGWSSYYWDSIKATFGFGAILT
ncbi:Activator heat shock protein ATPase 1 [Nymphon striatum]|nr:Activator heat shock protein ATPase 1 [Nymphon striatum]